MTEAEKLAVEHLMFVRPLRWTFYEKQAFLAGWKARGDTDAEIGKTIGCEMDSNCRTCRYVERIRALDTAEGDG